MTAENSFEFIDRAPVNFWYGLSNSRKKLSTRTNRRHGVGYPPMAQRMGIVPTRYQEAPNILGPTQLFTGVRP